MNKSEQNKGNLYILITAVLWSTGGILIKFIPGNPIAINGARSLVALIFFCFYRKGFKLKINKYVLLAGFCLMMTNTLYVMSNKLTTAGNAIVLQYLAPIFVLIWDSIYHKKAPSKEKIIFVCMAFCGMILFFFDQLDGGKLVGNLLAILSGVTFSGVFFVNSLPKASSQDASMFGFMLSFLVSIPFLTQFDYYNSVADMALIVLGVFQVGLAYVMFDKGSKLTSPVNASLIGLIEAILNPVWVFLFYGEKVGRFALIGAVIILCSVVLNIVTSNRKTVNGN